MLKQVLAYLVMFAFAMQLSSRIYVLINFQINKTYIAENLCEKRDEPESCCEGSCHLSKELNKIEEAEDQGPLDEQNKKKEKSEDFPLICYVFNKLKVKDSGNKHLFSLTTIKISIGFENEVIHPPMFLNNDMLLV